LAVTVTLSAAAAAGALLALGPSYLRVRFGAHEVISTIMTNNIISGVLSFAMASGFALQGTVRTQDLPRVARLPRLDAMGLFVFRGSAVSAALFIALGFAMLLWWGAPRLRALKEIELVGQNERAAGAAGIGVAQRRMLAFAGSGALCALAASATVLGYKGYYEEGLGAGAGFAGLGVALLGKGRVGGIVLAALLFATLEQGGLALNAVVPKEAMDVLSAVIVLVAALSSARGQALFATPAVAEEPNGT
jgi:simple sugar transport system permease protein